MALEQDPAFYEALGRAIKVLRTARKIERAGLAEASGLSYPYLSEIENGRKRASSLALKAIAEAIGVSMAELIGAAEDLSGSTYPMATSALRKSGAERPSPNRDAVLSEITAMMGRLRDEDLSYVRALLRRLMR